MSACTKNVAIILAAYNGIEYIDAQIESILQQDYPSIHLFIRDDGSTDGTSNLLLKYAEMANVTLIEGENLGVTGSVFAALEHIDSFYDYVAFSDQDDVWHEDKIARAVERLESLDPSIPLLYYSERNYCNADLADPVPSHLNRRGNGFQLSLFDNTCPGNTIVVNRAFLRLLRQSDPSRVYYHDWWMALIASGLGMIVYDEVPTLEYRRLADSVSPSGKTGVGLLVHRIKELVFQERFNRISDQLNSFFEIFGDELSDADRRLLLRFIRGKRISKALFPGRLRQRLFDEVPLRMCMAMGLL